MRHIFIVLTLFLTSQSAFALRAFFDYKVFHDPATGPYVECLVSFDGATFQLAKADSGLYQSRAELTIIFSKLDKVIEFRKVSVDGPLVQMNENNEFMSLERFSIPNGTYNLELVIKDLNNPADKEETMQQIVSINNPSEGIFISDIQFVGAYRKSEQPNAFTKSGMDMLPYNSNYFPSDLNSLMFYAEIYNTDKAFGEGKAFVTSVCVMDKEQNLMEECMRMKREKVALVVPVLQSLDISKLPSGEYKLRIEVRDAANKTVFTKERLFTRSLIKTSELVAADVPEEIIASSFAAKFNNRDSLFAIIQSHLPVANNIERVTIDNQLVTAELPMLQSYLYTFWYNRNKLNPESDFVAYMAKVDKVNEIFGTRVKPGWRTDRGRVYLQYGAPNTRVLRHGDPDYWPFEIWHYYETNNHLHDRRFLFYDTTLGGDFELLHTDVPAEPKNFDWKNMVRTRASVVNAGTASDRNANQNKDPYSGDELEDLWYNPH
jgi:GWxTD domain-containing protein